MQYFKDRTDSFDDYYHYSKKDNECNLDHVYDWIDLFVCMHNNMMIENKIPMLNEAIIS
jgi:hypothetical protein